MFTVTPPFPVFHGLDGSPLDNGSIYIGEANKNAEVYQIPIYFDSGKTIAAGQPLKTSGGYIVNNGTPARIYTESDFSITARDKNGAFVYSAPNAMVLAKYDSAVSVFDFGAVGNFVTGVNTGSDDTQAFIDAAQWARQNRRSVLVPGINQQPNLPNITGYQVNATFDLTAGDYYGACFIGENPRSSQIITNVSGTTPLFLLTGGSGTATNVQIANLSLVPRTAGQGVAIKINGNDFSAADNLRIDNFNYGIWLHNGTGAGTFTELTQVNRIWVNNCNNNIRIDVGLGDASFHGTCLDNVFMNVGAGQVGLYIGAGVYLYNSRLRIHFWGGSSATYIENHGNCEHNFVDMHWEGTGKIINTNRFHANGYFTGIGALQDLSATYPGSGKGFIVDNYQTIRTPSDANMLAQGFSSISQLPQANHNLNGAFPGIYRLSGANIETVAVDVFNGGNANGLAIGSSGFQQDIAGFALHHMLGRGAWTTFGSSLPIAVNGQPSTQFQLNSNGLHSGRMGKSVAGSVSANAGVPQTITVASANYASPVIGELLFFSISGTSFEWRGLFACNHNGYGSPGTITLLATFYTLAAAGVTGPSSFGINSSGQFNFAITTDRALTYSVKTIGISDY